MNTEQQQTQQQQAETTDSEPNLLKGPVTFGAQGVEIKDTDDLWKCASFILHSKIAPKDMKTVGAVMMAISLGAELGMKPMSAVQNIAVINGRPSIWGDAMLGLCRKSSLFVEEDFREWLEEDSADGNTAYCESRRQGGELIVQDQRRIVGRQRVWHEGSNLLWAHGNHPVCPRHSRHGWYTSFNQVVALVKHPCLTSAASQEVFTTDGTQEQLRAKNAPAARTGAIEVCR